MPTRGAASKYCNTASCRPTQDSHNLHSWPSTSYWPLTHSAKPSRGALLTSPYSRIFALAWLCASTTHFFCRAETGARCLTGDLIVDRPSQQICLFVRKSKGDQRRDARDKLVLAVPIPAIPILADLMDYSAHKRKAFCATYYNRPPYRVLEPLTFRSLRRLEGRRNTFHMAGPCAPHNTSPLHPASSGHRTSSVMGRRPPLAASALPSPSSNTWVAGPKVTP
jgi:hypothetical protein